MHKRKVTLTLSCKNSIYSKNQSLAKILHKSYKNRYRKHRFSTKYYHIELFLPSAFIFEIYRLT